MSAHVSKVIKSANYHIKNIGKVRKILNTDTTKSAIVSLVTSRHHVSTIVLDIYVELLMSYYAGSRKSKNNAARVVSGSLDEEKKCLVI